MDDLGFLIWLHDRLTEVYGENPNVDYMSKFRAIINTVDAAQVTSNVDVSLMDLRIKRIKAQQAGVKRRPVGK